MKTPLTISAMAGACSAGVMALAPVLLGRAENVGERLLYWEFFERGFEQAGRWGKWKAVRPAPGQALELYDLEADSSESVNVASRNPDILAQLERRFAAARTESAGWPLHLVRAPRAEAPKSAGRDPAWS